MAYLEGPAGQIADVDANLLLRSCDQRTAHGPLTGFYTVQGQSGTVAATLAAGTLLMSARFNPQSLRAAYITCIRTMIGVTTVIAAASIPGTIGLQRFKNLTPTGGTARTPNRLHEQMCKFSDMFDIRDSNVALTGSPDLGTVVSNALVPEFFTNGPGDMEWIFEPDYPLVLAPGDGICLRTQVAMPAVQTWKFNYTMHWYEE